MNLTPRQPTRALLWSDAVLDLQDLLGDTSHPPVYIVGGAVRDAYLGYPLKDIDLVTEAGHGVRLARKIADWLKGDIFIMDAARDVARVLVDTPEGRLNIDVSGFRGDDLAVDLYERDFTINAMAVDLRADISLLIDPHDGETDLKNRVIRLCAPHAIHTDPIRALRAVRMAVKFNARLAPETTRAIRTDAPRLHETSPERIRDEVFKLLESKRPSAALLVCESLGVLQIFVPELEALKNARIGRGDGWTHTLLTVEKLKNIQDTISPRRTDTTAAVFDMGMIVMGMDRYRREVQTALGTSLVAERSLEGLTLLAALIHNLPRIGARPTPAQVAEHYAHTLRLSNAEKDRLNIIITHYAHPVFQHDVTPLAAHRYWRQTGAGGVEVTLLMLADTLATAGLAIEQDVWIKLVGRVEQLFSLYFTAYDSVIAPPPVIDGSQLQTQLKLKPGRIIGELLDMIREGQVTGEVTDEQSALALARAYLKSQTDT